MSKRSLPIFLILVVGSAYAQPQSPSKTIKLSERLNEVRSRRLTIEKNLIESEQTKKTTQDQLVRLKSLQTLQVQEKALTQKRLEELKKYLAELDNRKEDVLKRIREGQFDLRAKIAKTLHPVLYRNDRLIHGDEGEAEAELKRHIYASVVLSELKTLESLNADLQDAEEIQARIEHEQSQMVALLQDLHEQDSLLQFHQKLREALTHEKQEERLKQLEEYRRLRGSEVEIERMIDQFQTRQEHAKSEEKKRVPVLTIRARSLPWPVKGKVVGTFGPQKDARTGLTIFRKGIEIEVSGHSVTSVMDGVVQFSGEIPGKGLVLIVEHPHDLYSIYGGLDQLLKQTGDAVKVSEKVATVGSQIYFEIRSRNLAIDPLKWLHDL